MSSDSTAADRPDVDRFGVALLSLARELWALEHRQAVLEAMLEDRGFVDAKALDAYEPSAATRAQLDARLEALVQGLLRDLTPAQTRTRSG